MNNKINIDIMQDEDGRLYVSEDKFFQIMGRFRKLLKDQKTALHTHNMELIDDCKRREQAVIDFVNQYQDMRTSIINSQNINQ